MVIAYIAAGVAAGILGGMGMGGGTVLIPILSVLLNETQKSAQAINLISFIPVAVIALIIHVKNKMIVAKGLWLIVAFGSGAAALGALCAKATDGETLRRIFGGFLTVLSIVWFFSVFKKSGGKKE